MGYKAGVTRWVTLKLKSQLDLAKELLHQFEIAQDGRSLSPSEVWLKNMLKKHSLAFGFLYAQYGHSAGLEWR
jgi:hypothetical protein